DPMLFFDDVYSTKRFKLLYAAMSYQFRHKTLTEILYQEHLLFVDSTSTLRSQVRK
ncbi:hypothetical protein H257_19146, partial [Aphanomyces astaci]